MNKKFKAAIIIFLLLITGALLSYKYIYNKPHPDFEHLNAEYTVDAHDLFNEFKNNFDESSKKYNGKILEINGTLHNIESHDSLMIIVFAYESGLFGDEGVRCTFLSNYNAQIKNYEASSEVTLKGFCSGFNQTDVIMEKCSIVKIQ